MRGQTAVLAVSTASCTLALAALALVPGGFPIGGIVALAAVAGAAHPPLAACLRALWPRLLGDAGRLHAAYALESAAREVVYILGPLVIVGAVATRSASLALGLCAILLVAGAGAFAAAPASRGWPPSPGVRRGMAGALRSPGIRTLAAGQALLGFSFAAIKLAVVAFAEDRGSEGATGPLLGVLGAASMLGGIVAARRGAPSDPAARLPLLLAAMAAGDALLVTAGSAWALAPALAVAGWAVAPVFALVYGLAGDVARAGTVTEAFTWLATGIAVGLALGAAVAGALADASGPGAAFAAAAAAVAAAALLARARARTLAPAASAAPA